MKQLINSLTDIIKGPPAIGHTPVFQNGVWTSRKEATFDVRTYGAVGDGSTDDTAAIQAAIDAANSVLGGTVLFPPGSYRCVGLILKPEVVLLGQPRPRSSSEVKYAVRLLAAGTGTVIDTPNGTPVGAAEINGFQIIGLGAATAGNGIRFRDANLCAVKNCFIHGFADEAILIESTSIYCIFEDIYVTQSLMNRTRSAKSGGITTAGSDHIFTRVVSGTSQSIEGTITDANLRCCGWLIRGGQQSFVACYGEISDEGFYLPTGEAGNNRFTSCRADLNYGHGWEVEVGGNAFVNCAGLSNGQATDNTYSNWRFTTLSGNNIVTNCTSSSVTTNKPKYGFEDLFSSAANKNSYSNCIGTSATTANFFSNSSNGCGFHFVGGQTKTLTVNSATPDVNGYERWATANTSATTITDFANGTQGQRLVVICGDANTTIQHNGATIVLMNPGNLKLVSGCIYEFTKNGSVWREITARDEQVGADVGDAAKSLQARVAETTQRWATPLTANRAVTLSTTGAYSGAKFRIVRTAAATGAFTLDVGTGPLKSLAAGQWADVEYNGAAWMLTGFGSL